jgi:hypothetical protein
MTDIVTAEAGGVVTAATQTTSLPTSILPPSLIEETRIYIHREKEDGHER